MEPREGDPANAEHATSNDYSCTDSYVHWKEHDEVGKTKSSAHIRCRWRNILTKLPEVMDQARKATTSFERWNCLITDEISDNITQLSIPTHAQLQRHRLKFIKNHLKNSYMFRSSTIFRELQCPR